MTLLLERQDDLMALEAAYMACSTTGAGQMALASGGAVLAKRLRSGS